MTFSREQIALYYAERLPELKLTASGEPRGPCPIHRGEHDNFAVNLKTGQWYCHSQCDCGGSLVDLEMAIEGADFSTARRNVCRIVARTAMKAKRAYSSEPEAGSSTEDSLNGAATPWRRVASYTYKDEFDELLYRAVRLERGHGDNREKKFCVERYDDGNWIAGVKGVRLVPYRLSKVLEAKRVFVVEGEKCCLALEKLEVVATTNPMGAGKWKREYAGYLARRHVFILPDNDPAGRAHAVQVAESLLDIAASVSIVELPRLPPKGDIVDWLKAGGTIEQLKELVRVADRLDAAAITAFREQWCVADKWPEPLPLVDIQPARLRADLIPGPTGEYIQALSAWSETPVELATLSVLGVLSCAVGGKLEVSPEPGYSEPCHLFLCAALESGNRKSSVTSAATEPLVEWENRAQTVLAPKIAHITSVRKTRMALIEKMRRQLQHDDREKIDHIAEMEAALPIVPTLPQLFTGDTTSERLEIMIAEQGGRAALISDEGGAFDVMAGRYSEKLNLDVFLKGHAGTPIRVQRVSRDPVMVDQPALTLLLSPQPGCLAELRENAALRHRGLLARFLYVLPASPIGGRALDPVPIPKSVKLAYSTNVQRLLDWKPAKRVTLSLSTKASAEWKAFQRRVETLMAEGGELSRIRDWGSKLPGAALRIAGILHAAKTEDLSVLSAEIRLPEMKTAVKLCTTLISHAIAVFGLMNEDPATTNAKRLLRWLVSQNKSEISRRDCFRAHQRHFFDRVEMMEAPLSILVRHNLIRTAKRSTGGRPEELIAINPSLLEKR